ncbi:MAG: transcription antitermination factor NusB [Gammaproteobacteria bacterium]|nr:transcription antitermination factor NusB [Gammaproteobacteria bacterium]
MTAVTGKDNRGANQARAKARRLALQALYQWDLSGTDLKLIEQQFRESEEFPGVDDEYFQELLHQVPARLDTVEAGLAGAMQIPWAELDPVERAVLRLASYELQARPDIPYRVVINEAVNLAKKFGAEQAHKFVNGVLDQAARRLRPHEQAK